MDSTKTTDRTEEKGKKERESGEERVVRKRRRRETREPMANGKIHFRSMLAGRIWRTGFRFFIFMFSFLIFLKEV